MIKALQLIFPITFMLYSLGAIAQKRAMELTNAPLEKKFEHSDLQWAVEKEHVSSTSGIRHVYYYQTLNDLPIFGTSSSLHIDKNGVVISENTRFISHKLISNNRKAEAAVSASNALKSALKYLDIDEKAAYQVIIPKVAGKGPRRMSSSAIYEEENLGMLGYQLGENSKLKLAWSFSILDENGAQLWRTIISATNGQLLEKHDMVSRCAISTTNDTTEVLDYNANLFDIKNYEAKTASASNYTCTNCYEVFEYPLENPYFGERTIVESPWNTEASPYGWHDVDGIVGAEFLTTQGNNVNAWEAGDHYGYQPNVASNLNFTGYSFDPVFMESNQSEDASLTNIFYWMNLFHDVSYVYGFTEVAGNHQQNNYGKGNPAYANDPLIVKVQSTLNECNASYIKYPDGVSAEVRMNLCNDKDGSFDTTVVLHEYAHAVSIRLETNLTSVCGGNKENPGEGWSDWYALMLTMTEADTAERPRSIGAFLINQGINGGGFRPYRYSTDMSINPQTFEDMEEGMGRHRVGAIWAEAMWEVTWSLIDQYGFNPDLYSYTGVLNEDAGNIMALAIATEALKLTECFPGLVSARDAVLLAAKSMYGNDVECLLWITFAKRGLGFGARSGSSAVVGDEIASFDAVQGGAIFNLELSPICDGAIGDLTLNGGYPLGGVYTGTGVTDNGNGRNFTFDSNGAGIGVHEVVYTIQETLCYPGSSSSAFITVVEDVEPPVVECLEPVNVSLHPSREEFLIPDYRYLAVIYDSCEGQPSIVTQDPEPGTMVVPGVYDINFYAEDWKGNNTSCNFQLEVERRFQEDTTLPEHLNDEIVILPNPSNGEMLLSNPYGYKIINWEVRDLVGRYVYGKFEQRASLEIPIHLESLAKGTYFVRVAYNRTAKTYRIIIE